MSKTTTDIDKNLIMDWLLGDKYSKVTFLAVIAIPFR